MAGVGSSVRAASVFVFGLGPLVFAAAAACSSGGAPASGSTVDAGGAAEDGAAASPDDAGAAPDAAGDGSPEPPPDPCSAKPVVCPTATTTEGAGLKAIDRCAFPIAEAASFKTSAALVTALAAKAPIATMGDVLADLNRSGTPAPAPGNPAGVDVAFRWETEDVDVATWIPQGISGSADASVSGLVNGRRVVLVSWYYTPPAGSTYEKGVRIAIVDVTNEAAPKYRFALLVEPKGTPAAPDFAPVVLHAGGIAWIGDLLYVAQTTRGFRVFDMAKMLRVATDVDEIGCASGTCRGGLYKYAIPQIGAYTVQADCDQLFSFVSLDRSTSPPSLLSGEYCSDTACSGPLAGRVFRWPLDVTTGKLASDKSWPSEALLFGHRQVQGAASRNGTYYLSSSAPAGGGGALYRVRGSKSATSRWIDTPEDLMVDEKNGLLWSLSEVEGERVVMGARLTSYPAP